MYIYTNVYMYICVHIQIYTYTYIYVYTYIHIPMYTCVEQLCESNVAECIDTSTLVHTHTAHGVWRRVLYQGVCWKQSVPRREKKERRGRWRSRGKSGRTWWDWNHLIENNVMWGDVSNKHTHKLTCHMWCEVRWCEVRWCEVICHIVCVFIMVSCDVMWHDVPSCNVRHRRDSLRESDKT